MPEFVLMPAPVMTTTFLAFHSEFAISCNKGSHPGSTWVVGIVASRAIRTASNETGGQTRQSRAALQNWAGLIVPLFAEMRMLRFLLSRREVGRSDVVVASRLETWCGKLVVAPGRLVVGTSFKDLAGRV
jgi:hypothetical protein